MLTTFDPQKAGLFEGEFTKVEVIDPAIAGNVPNLVIDPTKPFEIKVQWRLVGNDVPLHLHALVGSTTPPPKWSIEAYAESMGPGPDLLIASGNLDVGTIMTPVVYDYTLSVAANTLQEGNPGSGLSGVYKLICTCFLNSTLGPPGYDIAGFVEGPLIRVENPN